MRLTVLDVASSDIIGLARLAESLGYSRYWATEHHSPHQSAGPTVAVAAAAASTKRIRIGTAGILLNYRSPRQVVDEFVLLERLFGGRIDLGLAAARVPWPLGAQLLDGRPNPDRDAFDTKAADIVRMIRDEPLGLSGPERRPPEVWICGKSVRSATLAGRLSASYAFHHYMNQDHDAVDGMTVIDTYRKSYQERGGNGHAQVAIVAFGFCSPSGEDARRFWTNHEFRPNTPAATSRAGLLPANFVGDPTECACQLKDLAEHYQTGDVAIEVIAPSPWSRMVAFQLVAAACGLRRNQTA